VSGSAFTGNSASLGGGIENDFFAELTVRDCTFTSNSADRGGGIDNLGGTATVSGSAFTGNTANSGNGGLNNDFGGLLTQFDNQFVDDQPADVFP